jgi:hypothetical protein
MASDWILKLTCCFMATTHEPLHLDKRSFVERNIVDIPTRFIWIIIFFNEPFEYSDGGIFKLLRWVPNLHRWTWGHKLLYADRSSEDEQVLIRPLFSRNQKYEHGGRLKIKINILFYEDNSWTVALKQCKFCTSKYHRHTYEFYLNHCFLWRSFWIWWYFQILRLCWDKRWTTLCRIL